MVPYKKPVIFSANRELEEWSLKNLMTERDNEIFYEVVTYKHIYDTRKSSTI